MDVITSTSLVKILEMISLLVFRYVNQGNIADVYGDHFIL